MTDSMIDKVAAAIHGVEGLMIPFAALREESELKRALRLKACVAIEAMRDVPESCFDDYRSDKMWRDLNSKEVWNLWLDAALKVKS